MKKMLLVGRSESGKTTLTQALKGKKVSYHKTQYIHYHDVIIDTPGEYAENRNLSLALALYSYEADVVGLLISATEPYSLFPPNVAPCVNREVIGIVTKIDQDDADPIQAEIWLRLSGCQKVFHVSAVTGDGIRDLLTYLLESPVISL
ncbi:ethanolamine utilization protein EutP [Proteiniclasticum sp. SCR006]|uniref:Ethanolamine utilization protein EutP n=1 Tax=Proteiniclasticum aestuarii TaxID=2817862 RepID=A0A939H8Q5_9CLOT|nr:EutP/PduV family microcompartment system protein [Proteiniclasticum aestuarii]MBO1263452.1 ethanolamine utilization protein EutP [Proteiniclasticum aestuarii]